MRYLTVRLDAGERGGFHPVGKRLADAESITRERIHHVELLADGTVLTLAEGSGDRSRYERLMADSPHVERFLVSGDERWLATSQFAARGPARRLLERHRESDLVLETPIDVTEDGALELTFLGTDAEFRSYYDDVVTASDLDVEVVGTGPYHPDSASVLRPLTTRQQEVLRVAVELGYYANPREATHDDIAAELDVAATTVGDHLRNVEARVFETLAR
ncbi:helix-turn-helix domain-containing protein [Halorarius halobius]|uniref:helix-turn-helix domain-containing protein n=1 Tax=Halorarius halobius TaxID=2962671 RepID=UPI0020CC588E|nr:helix-turn-helix domain-containing protein [Halorarius halobius]